MVPPTTILSSENYHLRIPDESDVELVFSATRYPGFNDGMLWDPPGHRDEVIASLARTLDKWRRGKEYNFTVLDKVDGQQVARIGISKTPDPAIWNVGFWTHPKHQGRGIMTESLAPVLTFGFETLGADGIIAQYATWNKGSEKVLLANGFTFVKYLEQGFKKNGAWVPENEVALSAETWAEDTST